MRVTSRKETTTSDKEVADLAARAKRLDRNLVKINIYDRYSKLVKVNAQIMWMELRQ